VIQATNGCGSTGDQFELVRGGESVLVDVEGAVSVEENGGAGELGEPRLVRD
jgi:hypothetical protein